MIYGLFACFQGHVGCEVRRNVPSTIISSFGRVLAHGMSIQGVDSRLQNILWSKMECLAEYTVMMFAAKHMNPDELDDTKAFEMLCGTDAQREVACSYYFSLYSNLLAGCVRQKYPSLPSDLLADAVTQAFLEFYKIATASKDFDPEKPQRLLLKIALSRACDGFRKYTHRGKYKEESLEEIAVALPGTDAGAQWSAAVGGIRAREIQGLFRVALEKFGTKQRQVARLMVDRLDDNITDIKLAELYREKYSEPITVPAAKRAREEVRIKFRDILRKNGGD